MARALIQRLADDDPKLQHAKAITFYYLFGAAVASEVLFRVIKEGGPSDAYTWVMLIGAPISLAMLAVRRLRRYAGLGYFIVVLSHVLHGFPFTANHVGLALIICVVLSVLDLTREGEEQLWALGTIRCMLLLVMCYAGLQKLAHGYYFRGELLAFYIMLVEPFRDLFGLILPAAEIDRLRSYSFVTGAGPFRVDSALFIAVSNMSWIAEISFPLMLISRKTRLIGMLGMFLTVVAIEVAAREIYFGAMILMMLFLFAPFDLNRKLAPLYLIFYVWSIPMALGWLPGFISR